MCIQKDNTAIDDGRCGSAGFAGLREEIDRKDAGSEPAIRGAYREHAGAGCSVNGGGVLQVPMKWYGNSGWRGAIPGQPAGAQITYFVTALDFNSNLGTGPNRNFQILSLPCPADTNDNGVVNVDDLLSIINAWGQSNTTHQVSVNSNFFAPAIVNAKAGDTMQWNWVDGTHTATSGAECTPDGRFNNSLTAGMPTFTYIIPLDFSGAIPYYCIPHCFEKMVGMINVTAFPQDITANGVVDVDDLLAVINTWGPCP